MSNIKYFIPDIEDLKVGYECEICTNYGYESFNDNKEIWEKVLIEYKNEDGTYTEKLLNIIIGIDDGYQPVRVSYLTKEQIEAEGWNFKIKGIDLWFEKEVLTEEFDWSSFCNLYGYKPYKLFLNYGTNDNKIIIKCDFSGGADFSNSDILFEGECKDINTLKYISKLLKI